MPKVLYVKILSEGKARNKAIHLTMKKQNKDNLGVHPALFIALTKSFGSLTVFSEEAEDTSPFKLMYFKIYFPQ